MSRYLCTVVRDAQEVEIHYGFDHVLGYFYQEARDGEVVEDVDSLFHGLTGPHLAERLCGDDPAVIACLQGRRPAPVPVAHLERMLLDLPF